MTEPSSLPLWAAILVALFLLAGSTLTLLGTIALLRFKSFYQRIHAPTLGTTGGVGCIVIASIIFFSVGGSRLAVHEVLVAVFVIMTTPVTLLLLARAALYRDRTEGGGDVPPSDALAETPAPELRTQ